jgi:hypothetical protein
MLETAVFAPGRRLSNAFNQLPNASAKPSTAPAFFATPAPNGAGVLTPAICNVCGHDLLPELQCLVDHVADHIDRGEIRLIGACACSMSTTSSSEFTFGISTMPVSGSASGCVGS